MTFHDSNPSPEELLEWQQTATQRKAILPSKIWIQGHNTTIICGNCQHKFSRKLLAQRNDPVYVCPQCKLRNYLPVQW